MIAKRRLFLTADRLSVVPEGDKRAAFLLVPAGGLITPDLVAKYGLKDEGDPTAVSPEQIENRETRIPKRMRAR